MHCCPKIIVVCSLVLILTTSALRSEQPDRKDKDAVYPVAILTFEERGTEVKEFGSKIADLLFVHLAAEQAIMLVDRQDLQKQLSEQELSLSGLVKADQAVQVGQLTGAKLLISGSVVQVDTTLYLIGKVTSTETGRVVGVSAMGSVRDSLDGLVKQLAREIEKVIRDRAPGIVAKPKTRQDRLAELQKNVAKTRRGRIWIEIPERHIGQSTIDPAAETELKLLCRELGFVVIDSKAGNRKEADWLITGEGFSEFAGRYGNLVSVKARLELNAVDRKTGHVLVSDRQTSIAVDLSEQIAGKTALQEASATLAERLLPKLK